MPELSPIGAVTDPDPYPYYASLVAERPFGYDEGLRSWVAAGAGPVAIALADPALRVRPLAEPVPAGIAGTPAGQVFGSLIRMTDDPLARRLKNVMVTALAQVRPQRITEVAAARAARMLEDSPTIPLHHLMFAVPAQVIAVLCGLDEDEATEASQLTGDFVQCIPATATAEQQAAAAQAAGALRDLLGPADTLEPFVSEVARHDAPVQNTRRFAAQPTSIAGSPVAPGDAVLVVLAAANRDPAANPEPDAFRTDRTSPVVFTFGAAAHYCPGQAIAVRIASATVAEALSHGFSPSSLPTPVTYQPRANARIPVL